MHVVFQGSNASENNHLWDSLGFYKSFNSILEDTESFSRQISAGIFPGAELLHRRVRDSSQRSLENTMVGSAVKNSLFTASATSTTTKSGLDHVDFVTAAAFDNISSNTTSANVTSASPVGYHFYQVSYGYTG